MQRKKISELSHADLIRMQWLLVQFDLANADTYSLRKSCGKVEDIRIYRQNSPFPKKHFSRLGSMLDVVEISKDRTDYKITACDLGGLQAACPPIKPTPDSKKEQKTDEDIRIMETPYKEFEICLGELLRSLVVPYAGPEIKEDNQEIKEESQEMRTGAKLHISIFPVQSKDKVINCLQIAYEKPPSMWLYSNVRADLPQAGSASLFYKFVECISSKSNSQKSRYHVSDLEKFINTIDRNLVALYRYKQHAKCERELIRRGLEKLKRLVKQKIDLEYVENYYMDDKRTRIFNLDQYVIIVSKEFLTIKHNGNLLHHSPFACSKWAQNSDSRTEVPKAPQYPLDLNKEPVTWVCALLSEALTQQCKNSSADSLVSQMKIKIDKLLERSLQSSLSTRIVTQRLSSDEETEQSWRMDAADEKKAVSDNSLPSDQIQSVVSTPEINQCIRASTESIFKPVPPVDPSTLGWHTNAPPEPPTIDFNIEDFGKGCIIM